MKNKIAIMVLSGALLLPISAQALVVENVVTEIKTFSDVNSGTDYFASINWAVNQGIATGYADGRWGPNDCVTRAQLMKMIIIESDGSYGDGDGSMTRENAFKDVRDTDWFADYVEIGYTNGWVKGYSDGTFKPNQCVNRAEAMKIATNALYYNPVLDSSSGPVMYDDKIVSDIKISDWFGPYARYLFKGRLVGTNHTQFNGQVGGASTINFFPGSAMSRKEVAEMLHRIDVNLSQDGSLINFN